MVKIPYDKENEEKLREWSWKKEHQYLYPSNSYPIGYDGDSDKSQDISDNNKWVNAENDKIDMEMAINKLPPQQKRVAELVLEGYHLNEIAEMMKLAEKTIQTHFKRIKEKCRGFPEI